MWGRDIFNTNKYLMGGNEGKEVRQALAVVLSDRM